MTTEREKLIERKARELLDMHADPVPVAVEDGRWFMVREQDALDAVIAALSQPAGVPGGLVEVATVTVMDWIPGSGKHPYPIRTDYTETGSRLPTGTKLYALLK